MRKLMVLAAMLAMMMVAAAPAMAQTTDEGDGGLVDFSTCFPFCENGIDIGFDNDFEFGFDDGDFELDSGDNHFEFSSGNGDFEFGFDDTDSNRNNNRGNGGRN